MTEVVGDADLHEGAGIHQAGELAHDGHMLAGIPLGCAELTEVLHKVLHAEAHKASSSLLFFEAFIYSALHLCISSRFVCQLSRVGIELCPIELCQFLPVLKARVKVACSQTRVPWVCLKRCKLKLIPPDCVE